MSRRYPHTAKITRSTLGAQNPATGLPASSTLITLYNGPADAQEPSKSEGKEFMNEGGANGLSVAKADFQVLFPYKDVIDVIRIGDLMEITFKVGQVVRTKINRIRRLDYMVEVNLA